MLDQEYTDSDYQEIEEAEAASDDLNAERQYLDEVDYQYRVATSYPQNADAIFAANWLRGQGVW